MLLKLKIKALTSKDPEVPVGFLEIYTDGSRNYTIWRVVELFRILILKFLENALHLKCFQCKDHGIFKRRTRFAGGSRIIPENLSFYPSIQVAIKSVTKVFSTFISDHEYRVFCKEIFDHSKITLLYCFRAIILSLEITLLINLPG